jgi:NAD(P)H-nitrite reductase large subunit
MKHVIIGSGAAGIAAAKTIRNLSAEDEIIIVSSDELIYSRCMLHKYSGNERNIESLSFVPNDFFSKNNIVWYKDKCVINVNTKNNYIQLKDKIISYDKLLIATGTDAFVPNIGNLTSAKNVYSFKHLADAKLIRKKASDAENIIVIGAGIVGLDVAYALLKLKKSVTVIEMAPRFMPLNLDTTAATVYQKLFEHNGCTFRLNSKIVNTLNNEKNNTITHIVLENGENLPCDMVIVAVGVRPSVKFLDDSGIKCEHGVVVDQYLMTSCENVYAAGSVTALGDIWPCAVRQGETAAKNMCGIKTVFTDTFSAKNAIVFFDLPTVSIGTLNPKNSDAVLTREGFDCYQKFILRNNHVIGVILQGNIAYSGIWQYLIKNKIDLSKLKKPLWDLSFADFYDINTETGKYLYKNP